MKALLLMTILVLASCGQERSGGSAKQRPKWEPARNDGKKLPQPSGRARYINISYKKLFEVTNSKGVSSLLKCYDKRAYIYGVKFYSTNRGDTAREIIANRDQLGYGFIPYDIFGISLVRWPEFNKLDSRRYKTFKKRIRKYCNGKSYIYLEDYKRGLAPGKHFVVAEIRFMDNTIFNDYHIFEAE